LFHPGSSKNLNILKDPAKATPPSLEEFYNFCTFADSPFVKPCSRSIFHTFRTLKALNTSISNKARDFGGIVTPQ
jgi:hypothetical protein